MSENSEPTVTNNLEKSRFEMQIDGNVAFLNYRKEGERMTMVHTEVPEALGGRGLGGKLASEALDHAREEGLGVVPSCPFVRTYIERHPEYADLVVES